MATEVCFCNSCGKSSRDTGDNDQFIKFGGNFILCFSCIGMGMQRCIQEISKRLKKKQPLFKVK